MFEKKPTTTEEQIALLKSRGLEISSDSEANHFLSHISYYRLGEYWHSMQFDKEKHIFKPNSKFEDVIALYCFDREIRLLIFDTIEKIEISLRTKLIYHLSHEFDPWWFQNFDLFTDSRALVKTLASIEEELSRSKDSVLNSHFKKHKDDTRFPPAWKTLEHTSFGSLSKLYGNLKHTVKSKDEIAKDYGAVNHTFLPSWLQSIAQIRNYCAHHARLWNRNLPGTVKLLSNPPHDWIKEVPKAHEFQKLYVHLCIMKYLLNIVAPGNHMTSKLNSLFDKYPNVDPNALGMRQSWQEEALWKNNLSA
ncbi:Abi family protein [Aquiflexum sp. LQ15W]|uniref:Abi family protein n=1 Tax=Cognataquiflexum nitidum TaxID=2922272 RepID=UPI001F144C29|nr:Abi family protein [Cognataquiflexum nitidum]MCH6201373.1 Abi family protein [Cognataquiflexum nitidum]